MARRPTVIELPALSGLDKTAGNLSRQLAQSLREAIQSGSIQPGEVLPSSRRLAESMNVSRGVIVEAFDQLKAEGFLDSSSRGNTRVASSLQALEPPTSPAVRALQSLPQPLTDRMQRLAAVVGQFQQVAQVPFAVSVPTGRAAPDDIWRRLGNKIRARGPGAPGGYGDPQGAIELRTAIADYVRRSRSVRCDASQVIITAGTQQGLYLACQVLLDEGEIAWVENPAYRGITAVLENSRPDVQIVRVPVDSEGLQVSVGVNSAPAARAVFASVSHQYPLGMPLSMSRRLELLAWARASSAWIVEDDYDAELRYAGHPFPSLQGLDPARVIYLGTFSKILFPSLRIGYVIVPPELVGPFCGARALIDRHPPNADQHVLAAFIADGHLEAHIRKIRGVYSDVRANVIAALSEYIPSNLAWLQPSDQGMHMVLWLTPHLDDVAIAKVAADQEIVVRAISPMYSLGDGLPGLVLGLGGFTADQVIQATKTLARIIVSASESTMDGG